MVELFYERPYDSEFEAEVVKVVGNQVVLSQTLFYPEGGGQPSDIGELDGVKVVKVIRNEEIIHILEKEPSFKQGFKVHGRIDWGRRYRLMRLHTSLHLLINICERILGPVKTAGSGLSEAKGHVDISSTQRIKPELRERIEREVDEAIRRGAEVETWFKGGVRLVKINGFNELMCGGTHIKNISEIGGVKLRRINIGRNKDRIEVYLTQ